MFNRLLNAYRQWRKEREQVRMLQEALNRCILERAAREVEADGFKVPR